ncbi:hypothetical protein JXA12_00685 [Candidatus Woesearchaeota archaeon]|nr:hypothetical protein [Candidatus Woesearchaeota archaeon]
MVWFLNKKAIHGIGILLIFLAVIFMSVTISALVISQGNKMVGEANVIYDNVHNTYKDFQIVEVAGFDGRNGELDMITVDAKLIGDSSPMNLAHLSISIGEEDFRTILIYRGDDAPIENSNQGYNTWSSQQFGEVTTNTPTLIDADLDDDGQDDYLWLNDTHAIISLSGTAGNLTEPLGVDLSAAPVALDVNWLVTNGERYATVTISGTTDTASAIDEDVDFTLKPYHEGGGYYVTEHLIRVQNSINGFIIPGDVVRFHVDTHSPIEEDDIIQIRFFYRNLETAGKRVFVGNTFPDMERVILWPKP